jgi:hypothetical protein
MFKPPEDGFDKQGGGEIGGANSSARYFFVE